MVQIRRSALEWDGTRWKIEKTRRAFYLVRLLCRAGGNAKSKTVAGVTSLVQADRRQAATTEQWDADLWILGTDNGTIDLRSGELYAPRPLDYITKVTSVAPGNDDCPLWLFFLDRVTARDKELQHYLQRVAGYCVTGDISEEALFFLYGTGRARCESHRGFWYFRTDRILRVDFLDERYSCRPSDLRARWNSLISSVRAAQSPVGEARALNRG